MQISASEIEPKRLSPNFTLAEMCVTNQSFPNNPPPVVIEALTALCKNVLEPLREHFRKKYPARKIAVIVTSGYRSDRVNAAVGGSETSQHRFGEAADIRIPGIPNQEIWRYIADHLQYDQVIAEKLMVKNGNAGWIHVSYRAGRLRKSAISFLGSGKYVPGLHFVD